MERAQMRRRPVIALALVSVLIQWAYVPASARPVSRSLPTLTLNYLTGISAWVTSLDPANSNTGFAAAIEPLVHAGLVRILPNGRVGDDLAAHWKVSKDGKVYTFYLHSDPP